MVTQKGFTEELKETVNRLMGGEYRVQIHCIEKANIGTVHMLTIRDNKHDVSPSFYIEEFYKAYQNGKASVKDIAEEITHIYKHSDSTNLQMRETLQMGFNSKEWVKERLFLQLINSSKNERLLQDSVYMDFKGLSLVLNAMATCDERRIGKIRITKAMFKEFGWQKEEILDYALKNTMKLFPYEVTPLCKVLSDIVGCPNADMTKEDLGILVLTNDRGINGATAIFYPDVLKTIATEHGTNLFLLPSSIHEFIVLEGNSKHSLRKLKDMVQTVNISDVAPEDVLSDDVYYYERSSGILSVFKGDELEEVAMP